jgi:hypothetical protein
MSDRLHAALFGAQLRTTFSIHLSLTPVVEVELVEVAERDSGGARHPHSAAIQERFSLVFRGPDSQVLQQGIYQLQHDRLGAFELFLVPVGQDNHGVYYEAVFNRFRRRDD